jgi:hypothetical protein
MVPGLSPISTRLAAPTHAWLGVPGTGLLSELTWTEVESEQAPSLPVARRRRPYIEPGASRVRRPQRQDRGKVDREIQVTVQVEDARPEIGHKWNPTTAAARASPAVCSRARDGPAGARGREGDATRRDTCEAARIVCTSILRGDQGPFIPALGVDPRDALPAPARPTAASTARRREKLRPDELGESPEAARPVGVAGSMPSACSPVATGCAPRGAVAALSKPARRTSAPPSGAERVEAATPSGDRGALVPGPPPMLSRRAGSSRSRQ